MNSTTLAAMLIAMGLYVVLTANCQSIYAPSVKALRNHGPKRLTQTDVAVGKMARQIVKYIHLEPMKRGHLEETLRILGREETPEYYTAQAMSRALIFAVAFIWVPLFSIPLGIGLVALTAGAIYHREQNRVQKELEERRQLIERELPQFASTIAQSLNSTRDVVSILASYRKICGVTLAGEIDKTLNDIMTGNAGQALKALEGRVSSPKLAQLTRGLQAVLRGDDQRIYFDLLAAEYRKAQDEEIKKILLNRPKQLYAYLGVLFFTLMLMIAASLGTDLMNRMGNFG